MRSAALLCAVAGLSFSAAAQEANSGIDLRATVTGEAVIGHELTESPRDGAPVVAGFRSMLYPTWKLGEHWTVSGVVDVESRPYFAEEFSTQGYGAKFYVLQANLGYSKVSKAGSVVVRVGQLTSTFGSFLLRYDDADNPLLGMPMQYGYYYAGVTFSGLAGAQIDATHGKWDGRVQFANSSPANPRSIFAKDQYANWEGGAGYTILQGLRVGVSGYRGPYLDRTYAFFRPGESNPVDLPASAGGVDVEWARGHWNVYGEWQRFAMTYHQSPTFRDDAGYVEAKRVLHPRWFVAARAGYLHGSYQSGGETYETAVGYRPNAHQLIKLGYSIERQRGSGSLEPVFGVQIVTMLHPLSLAWR
ncbi:MAG TPA: hypothetical protein VG297_22010 [Bryobacteraceae bacterium]|jgi:hypothetical protein|nr:hypothetical protein [Bryobacteraceae bacterium]